MKSKVITLITLVVLSLTFFYSCSDNPTDPVNTTDETIVTPSTIYLTNNDTAHVWVVVQQPSPFNWVITKYPKWIKLPVEAGTSGGSPVKIILSGNVEPTESRTMEDFIEIKIVGKGTYSFKVVLSVNNKPKLAISPKEISLYSSDKNYFNIKNIGGGLLKWKLKCANSNICFSTDSGSVSYNNSQMITISADIKKFKPGTFVEYAYIYSDTDTISLKINLTIQSVFNFSFPKEMLIDYLRNDTTFYLKNYGNEDIKWNFSTIPAYITLDPASGTLLGGDSIKVALSVIRQNMLTMSYNEPIKISYSNKASDILLTVNHFKEEKTFLSYDIVDAKFSLAQNLIYIAAKSPNQILIMDFDGKIIDKISLPRTPLCLSNISNDKLVVASSGSLSVLNIATKTLLNQFNISCDPVSVVISNNKAYASPYRDQWENIRSVDLATGKETLQIGSSVYAGADLIIHPSGQYVYYLNHGLSPQDMGKLDTRTDTVKYLYDSPYHGDYNMGNYFWMADDGNKIFTSSGNIFKCDEVRTNDMTYLGNLGYSNLHSLAQNQSKNIIATVYNTMKNYSNGKTYMSILEPLNYNQISNIVVPVYNLYNPGSSQYKIAESLCRFLFVNAEGTKVLMLLNPYSESSITQVPKSNWSFYSVNI